MASELYFLGSCMDGEMEHRVNRVLPPNFSGLTHVIDKLDDIF